MNKKIPNLIDTHVGNRVRMRRRMLAMSQTKLADAIGLTFQQVQKYEKGTNRMGASRIQQIASVLQVPVPYFFEGTPGLLTPENGALALPSTAYVSEFLSTKDGIALTRAFTQIKDSKVRRRIVDLVEQIAVNYEE